MRAHRSGFVPVELMPIRFAIVLSREALQVLSQERLLGAIHLLRACLCQLYIDDLLIELLHTLHNSQSKKIALIMGFKKNAENEIAGDEAGGLKLIFPYLCLTLRIR